MTQATSRYDRTPNQITGNSTLQVVEALVESDKDFDFILMSSGGHGAAGSAYGWRWTLDFLRRHLDEK